MRNPKQSSSSLELTDCKDTTQELGDERSIIADRSSSRKSDLINASNYFHRSIPHASKYMTANMPELPGPESAAPAAQSSSPTLEEAVTPEPERKPRTRRRNGSTSSDLSDSDFDDDEEKDQDGHRPSSREVRKSISRSRSRASYSLPLQQPVATATGIGAPISKSLSRRDTALSRLRTRTNTAPFTHPLAHQQTTADVLVDFDGPDDPYRPMNWPTKKKVLTTMMYGMTTMTATWASSAYSAGTRQVAEEFHVGNQVAVLGTTLFLFGFGTGPLLWAPLSEVFGRKIAVLTPMFVAMCFSFGSATAKDFQTLMLTRFFGAFFASAPVTNTGGVLGDLFSPAWRALALAGYAMAVVGGPCLGMRTSLSFSDQLLTRIPRAHRVCGIRLKSLLRLALD